MCVTTDTVHEACRHVISFTDPCFARRHPNVPFTRCKPSSILSAPSTLCPSCAAVFNEAHIDSFSGARLANQFRRRENYAGVLISSLGPHGIRMMDRDGNLFDRVIPRGSSWFTETVGDREAEATGARPRREQMQFTGLRSLRQTERPEQRPPRSPRGPESPGQTERPGPSREQRGRQSTRPGSPPRLRRESRAPQPPREQREERGPQPREQREERAPQPPRSRRESRGPQPPQPPREQRESRGPQPPNPPRESLDRPAPRRPRSPMGPQAHRQARRPGSSREEREPIDPRDPKYVRFPLDWRYPEMLRPRGYKPSDRSSSMF
ncbi:hypothetical protein VF21_07921 [Pseudogymnoascus sp. 05NY08]|nr:hypothetical protein VF21_07921 [Pseudogymnoascus sp. 05NY08]